MITLTLFLISIAICILHFIINHNRYAKSFAKIPGPPLKFFFGNSLDILRSPVELFSVTRKWATSYNGIYRFYAYLIGAIQIYNPEDIEVITSNMKYHQKSNIYRFLKPWLRDGLLLSHGSKWQHRRKILTSAFHFNVLQKYHPAIEDNSERFIKEIEKHNGKIIDIVPVISKYTLNTICETAMGTQLNEETSSAGKSYKEAIHSLGKILLKRLISIVLHNDIIFNLTSIGKQHLRLVTIVHKFTNNVIKERKQKFEADSKMQQDHKELPENTYQYEHIYGNKKKRNAMLDLLLSAERDGLIDHTGIQEEVDTFMFEGHDTTAAGLTYSILSIANDQAVQDKIIEELNEIFGKDTRQATMEDLTKMSYLDRCIKESLRLYPPVPFISRELVADTILSGYNVPAGSQCHIHIFDLHRQEHLFKDPLRFDPDRFLPENSVGRHNYAYIPFSAGPRNCIGQKFAVMEMKSALSAILRNFYITPVTKHTDLCFSSDLVLRNTKPVHVKFIKRCNSL